jgi:hypothetical protein
VAEDCRRAGKIGIQKMTREMRSRGGRSNKEKGKGIFGRTPEQWSASNREKGILTKKLGVGFFAMTHEEHVAAGRKGGTVSGPGNMRKLSASSRAPEIRAKGRCARWNISRGKPCTCGGHQNSPQSCVSSCIM